MLSCSHTQDLLSARIDGELAGEEARRVDAHLASCAECRALADGLTAVDRFLTSEPPLPADPRLTGRLRAALAAERANAAPVAHLSPVAQPVPAAPPVLAAQPAPAALPAPPPGFWISGRMLAGAAVCVAMMMYARVEPRRPDPLVVAVASPAAPIAAIKPVRRDPPQSRVQIERVGARLRSELAQLGRDLAETEANLGTFKVAAARESREQHERFMARSFETWK